MRPLWFYRVITQVKRSFQTLFLTCGIRVSIVAVDVSLIRAIFVVIAAIILPICYCFISSFHLIYRLIPPHVICMMT